MLFHKKDLGLQDYLATLKLTLLFIPKIPLSLTPVTMMMVMIVGVVRAGRAMCYHYAGT